MRRFLRFSPEGWQKIAGGKQRVATGIRPKHAIYPEGVAEHSARIRDNIRTAIATPWTQTLSLCIIPRGLILADSNPEHVAVGSVGGAALTNGYFLKPHSG
ncbi:MAG: hypothetical protein WCK86_23925 [Planctomycetia bacterium]